MQLSLWGFILNTFSYMIKIANLNPAFQMLSFGRLPQWSLFLILQRWPDHHLNTPLNRPQVLAVLSSGLTPMDITFSSIFILMVLDPLLANVLHFYSPFSLVTKTICSNLPSRRSSTLVSVINLTHWTTGWRYSDTIKTQLTKSPPCQQKLESQQS